MSGIVVVGAGMAGLLAGSMLRKDCPLILEARERLPHNHSAVLRFRSSIVGDTVGIPLRGHSYKRADGAYRVRGRAQARRSRDAHHRCEMPGAAICKNIANRQSHKAKIHNLGER
jgi:cation diffusion facilitator CzcD-associated flavoprotein CzcO